MLDQSAHQSAVPHTTPSQAVTNAPLEQVDPELAAVLDGELGRQRGRSR